MDGRRLEMNNNCFVFGVHKSGTLVDMDESRAIGASHAAGVLHVGKIFEKELNSR